MLKTKILVMITTLALLVSTATACNTKSGSNVSKETVFDFYNKTVIDQTKAQVDAALGVVGTESKQMKNLYNYTDQDTSYGVSVLFSDKNLATSKTLLYPNVEDIAFLTTKKVTQAQSDSIAEGSTYDQVKALLGQDGIEISTTQIAFDGNKLSKIYIWANADGSMLQVVFGSDGKSSTPNFFD